MLKREKFLLWTSQSSKLNMGIEILVYVIIEINNIHSVDKGRTTNVQTP